MNRFNELRQNNVWKNYEKYLKNRNNDNNNNNNNVANDPVEAYLDMQYQPPANRPWEKPYIKEEDVKVGQFIKAIHDEFYPLRAGETIPQNWINSVVNVYQQLRQIRAKDKKVSYKDGLKGLRMHLIVSTILYCVLIIDRIAIPSPLYLHFINVAINKSSTAKSITLKQFENYRTDAKKGIRKYLSKVQPLCYNDELSPDLFIPFGCRVFFNFSEQDIRLCQRIARNSYELFDEQTTSSQIAIACILLVGINKGYSIKAKHFEGITEARLKKLYKVLYDNQNVMNNLRIKNVDPKNIFVVNKSSVKI